MAVMLKLKRCTTKNLGLGHFVTGTIPGIYSPGQLFHGQHHSPRCSEIRTIRPYFDRNMGRITVVLPSVFPARFWFRLQRVTCTVLQIVLIV